MLSKRCVVAAVACVCVCALLGTGCSLRRRPKGRSTRVDDDSIGVVPTTVIDDEGLPIRIPGESIKTVPAPDSFENVYFDFDKAQIKPEESGKVEAVARYLKSHPALGLIVEGHCDERGSNEYNMALGERRALAVRAYLIGLGIDGARVQTKSYGEESPVDPGHNEEAWRVNRRAEFVLHE
ncbi:MAG: peptidoglycan-associated lipoprotein Pal [Kiritimatiellae bacterium]|nr:peptidoglycan-associated lipoprotein Pal [Kiritimatiellia bacterium]